MSNVVIVTGDDGIVIHTLKKNGATFSIPSGATVTCRLLDSNHKPITASVEQVNTTSGADWFNSKVAVVFPGSVTEKVSSAGVQWRNGITKAKIETQVDDNGKLTWFHNINVVLGTVA